MIKIEHHVKSVNGELKSEWYEIEIGHDLNGSKIYTKPELKELKEKLLDIILD